MGLFDRLEIVGHRGAMAYAPENTLSSFRKALELGATMVEFDLRLSADRRIVVMHDDDVQRTTNGQGKLGQLTYSEIQALDAGGWFSPEFAGEKVPSLTDVLTCIKGKAGAMIEIKDEPGWSVDENLMMIIDQIKQLDMLDQVEVISFNHAIVARIKMLEPSLQTGILYVHAPPRPWKIAREIGAEVVHPCPPRGVPLTDEEIQSAQAHGMKVVATTNDRDEMKRFVAAGVDAICSDYPDWIKQAL